jgi:lipopolysaccharide/colanic/teichoic acid biosynthesis glycosyltransferase
MSVQDYSEPTMKAASPVLERARPSLAAPHLAAKRVLDVVVAGIAILFCLPLFLLIPLAIVLDCVGWTE